MAETAEKLKYLFCWDEIPGNDDRRLIKFLKQNFSIDWVKTAKIEKIDDGRIISVSTKKNSLFLRHNKKKAKVYLKIDDGRTDKFITKTENGKLNIYESKKPEISELEIERLRKFNEQLHARRPTRPISPEYRGKEPWD